MRDCTDEDSTRRQSPSTELDLSATIVQRERNPSRVAPLPANERSKPARVKWRRRDTSALSIQALPLRKLPVECLFDSNSFVNSVTSPRSDCPLLPVVSFWNNFRPSS